MTPPAHVWEEQIAGDPSRYGCARCGGERDDRHGAPRYRMPEARKFTLCEPACRPARGRQIPHGNPENARRALRACGAGPARESTGARCVGCGYGWQSVNEAIRFAHDCEALEREGTDDDRAILEARAPRRGGVRRRRRRTA